MRFGDLSNIGNLAVQRIRAKMKFEKRQKPPHGRDGYSALPMNGVWNLPPVSSDLRHTLDLGFPAAFYGQWPASYLVSATSPVYLHRGARNFKKA